MDLKIYSLERNPRLWLDSWQSLETLAKIISVTSISDLNSFLDDIGVVLVEQLPHCDPLRLEHCCRSRIRRWRITSTAWCSWPARRLRTAAISSRPSTSSGSRWPPHPGRTPFRWAIWSCVVNPEDLFWIRFQPGSEPKTRPNKEVMWDGCSKVSLGSI